MKRITALFLSLLFINQASAVDNCPSGQSSLSTVFINTTPVIGIPEPLLCKPLKVNDFMVSKEFNTQNYSLNWSKQDHISWHVNTYEVRANGGDITRHDVEVNLPLNLTLGGGFEGVANFEVRACAEVEGVQACGDWKAVNTECGVVCVEAILDFQVFEDAGSNSRFLDWQINSDALPNNPQVEYIRIRMYDQDMNIIDQLHLDLDLNQTQLFSNNGAPVTYGISLCFSDECSDEILSSEFGQGLTKVKDVEVIWDLSNPAQHKFEIQLAYPAAVFNTGHGKPHYFEIKPMFNSANNPQDVITVAAGSTYQNFWLSNKLNRADIIGDDFTVKACRSDLGCGPAYYLMLSEPISADDIPQPQLVFNGNNNTINVTDTDFYINWEFPANYTDEELSELIDYIEVVEWQPHGSKYAPLYRDVANFPIKAIKYYTEDILNPLNLHRLAKGEYQFQVKACKRDRVNGDRCSLVSDSLQYKWVLKRGYNSVGSTNNVENWGWYENNGEKGIKWQFNSTSTRKPDYFYLSAQHHTNARCIRYDSNGQVEETKNTLMIPYSEATGINFDLSNYCDDFKTTDSSGNVLGEPTGTWKIQGCFNGAGCGGYTTIYNPTAQYTYQYFVDFSDSSIAAPLNTPPGPGRQGIIGGPGDMKPGGWWNPDQSGTGWHFYWASELRYPSVHENYGRTYDLLGFWMAYMEVDDVWTPTWFFSQMKQTQGAGANDPQFFQGDLLYLTYDKDTGKATPQHVGRLQTDFSGNDNQHVSIKLDIDFEHGIWSGEDVDPDYQISFDEYQFELQDFSILSIGGNTPENNDADHYSGAWWHYKNDGSLDEKFTWLTWIENFLEVTTVLTYDTEGDPVWVQAHTCNPDVSLSCNPAVPGAGYYDSYVSPDSGSNRRTFMTVRNGFNPLGKTRDGFDFDEELVFIGRGGRSFNSQDEFTMGDFWLNVQATPGNNSLINRSINLNYGTSQSQMYPFQKIASFHDIRFFINNQNESITTCDPNDEDFSTCQIKFTWFTDDDFPSIEPFYRFNDGEGWTAKQPLSNLCPGVPLNNYVVTDFVCDNFTEDGDYEFFLNKDSYLNNQPIIEIAESKILTILPCISTNCNSVTMPLAAAPAPEIESYMDSIAADPLNDLVGVTAGAFDVDESGSANYSLPIYAPKGRGGLAPQLALSYNSNASNGIAGQGWNIAGASSITRCLRSKEHDPGLTYYPGITMTWDDVFCIDGMRMFKVSETADEVEYRTEIANFSKITAEIHGDYPNGPRKFIVTTKSGEKWTYGSPGGAFKAGIIFPANESTGSQILANDGSGTVHTWLISQISDRSKELNRIKFSYDSKDGESYLSLVRWSGFGNGNSPHYKINFNYSTNARTDAMYHYGIGTEYKSLLNLESVSTFIRTANISSAPFQEVRRLKLNYEEPNTTNNPTGNMRLLSAEQCVDNGNCLKPIEFTWDDGDTAVGLSDTTYEGTKISKLKEMGYGSYKPIDINGDGVMEMIFIRGYDRGNWAVQNIDARYWIVGDRSNISLQGANCENLTEAGENPHFDRTCNTDIQPFHADEYDEFNSEKWFVYDFNGDGYQDILTPQRNGNATYDYLKIFYSNGSQICLNGVGSCAGLTPHNTTIKQHHVKGGSSFLDYTADGVPDLITFQEVVTKDSTLYKYKLFTTQRIQRNGSQFGYAPAVAGSQLIDINSDELEPIDITCRYTGSITGNYSCMRNPISFEQVGRIKAGKIEQAGTDFNGDGYNDLLYTYKYQYSSLENCLAHFDVDPIPRRDQVEDPLNDIPENEYSVDLIERDTEGNPGASTRGGISTYGNCEHQFKAIMLFDYNDQGQPTFNYAGRLGIINNFSDTNPANNYEPENVICQGDSLTDPSSGCGFRINESGGGVKVLDVNGDSLGDLVSHSSHGAIYYYLHTGQFETATMTNVSATPVGSFEFEKVMFGSYQTMVPDFYSANSTYGDGFCDTGDRTDFDDNACARAYLTQFIDYDLDGDLDALVPSLVSETAQTTSYYQLYRYGLGKGGFGYEDVGTTGIEAWYAKKDSGFVLRNDRQPQDYNNAFWDINGDGHYDYFSLLRKITQDETKLAQHVQLGSNSWQTRNKITDFNNPVGNAALKSNITVSYESATDPSSSIYTRAVNSLNLHTDFGNGSPVFDIMAPMYLVGQVGKSSPSFNDPNSMSYMTYAYEGFKIQGGGRGSLGFAAVLSIDPYHDITTRTDYLQEFPYIGMPEITQVEHNSTGQLSFSQSFYTHKEFAWPGGRRSVWPYLKRSYEKSNHLNVAGDKNQASGYSINGISDHKVMISDFIYSAQDVLNGNLTQSDVRTCIASTAVPTINQSLGAICGTAGKKLIHSKITNNSYADDNDNWLLGRLASTSTTEKRLLNSVDTSINGTYRSKTRSSAFKYDPVTGQLTKEEVLGSNENYLKTLYTYDDYGQSNGKFQCSYQLSDAACASSALIGRHTDNTRIHRYSLTVYDTEWSEYVERINEPFTLYDAFDHHSDTALVENNQSGFPLDDGLVFESATSFIYPDNHQAGSPVRDIYGNPYLVGDANQVKSRSVFGVFGDLHASAGETGGFSKMTKRWCAGNDINTYRCPSMASTVMIEHTKGAPISRKYYDVLGREVRAQTQNFNGEWQTLDTQYDLLGRTVKQTEPYTMNNAGTVTSFGGLDWNETKFDPLDRVVLIENPMHCEEPTPVLDQPAPTPNCVLQEVITTTEYSANSVSTLNSKGQNSTQVFDLMGTVIQNIDNIGNTVDYGYDAHGNLTETTSYLNGNAITIVMEYDELGRKVNMNDPDKGFWQYFYNPAGDLIEQRSANTANAWAVKNWYDIRGRLVYRMDADGSRSILEYDLGIKKGMLVREHIRGQYQSEGIAQSKQYEPDAFYRPMETLTVVYDEHDSTTPAVTTYVARTVYDQYSRVFQKFDSMDDSYDENHHGLQFFYNDYGYQVAIKDAENGLNGQEYHRILEVDRRGQVVFERHHGNFETWKGYNHKTGFLEFIQSKDEFGDLTQDLSYAFDRIGNLTRRTDQVIDLGSAQQAVNEFFIYDDLNRLLEIYRDANDVGGNGTYTTNLRRKKRNTYDESGNLTYKSGHNMAYAHPNKPHAVTKVSNNPASSQYFEKHYQYDNNGNVTRISDQNDATLSAIDYSSFDKATRMEAKGWISDVFYNTARSRYIRKDHKVDQSEHRVTHYLGSVEYIYEDGETRIKRHLGNVVIESNDHNEIRSQWKHSYLLKDHLGSTHTVVNRQGQLIERFSFDAWGERRRPPLPSIAPHVYWSYWGGLLDQLHENVDNTTNRGFTGHEHFDQVGIIHMNGRIYDPTIGRFLQADPIIEDPYNTQSLNRYSYVMNNPLSFNDPSGYSSMRSGWWRMPVAIAITIYTAGAASSMMSLVGTANTATISAFGSTVATISSANAVSAAFITSIAGGSLAGGVSSGNLKGAVKGGIVAAVTFGIGHGMDGLGGVGDPGSASRIFAHSMVSGISAEVDGGKFGHGFMSAVISQNVGKGAVFDYREVGKAAIVSNAILQGTVSELTGGKFASGALSAAFRTAYNHLLMIGDKTVNDYTKSGRFVCQSSCPWTTENGAHKAAANAYMSLSLKDNKEYGWNVYKHADGSYTYTFANIGDRTSVYPGKRYSDTSTYAFVSSGHTHVDGNLEFSPKDVNYVTQHTSKLSDDRPLYLIAQDGNMYSLSSETALKYSSSMPGSRIQTKIATSLSQGSNVPMSSVINQGPY